MELGDHVDGVWVSRVDLGVVVDEVLRQRQRVALRVARDRLGDMPVGVEGRDGRLLLHPGGDR